MLPIQFPAAVLALVMKLKVVNRLFDIRRDDNRNVRICRPCSSTEDVDVKLNVLALGITLSIFESLLLRQHLITANHDVFEHLLQVLSETAAPLCL